MAIIHSCCWWNDVSRSGKNGSISLKTEFSAFILQVTYGSYGSAVYSFVSHSFVSHRHLPLSYDLLFLMLLLQLLGGIFTILVVYDVEPFHFFGQTIGSSFVQYYKNNSYSVTRKLLLWFQVRTMLLQWWEVIYKQFPALPCVCLPARQPSESSTLFVNCYFHG